MEDLQIKARFWWSFSGANTQDASELRYQIEDAMPWFADALVADLERVCRAD
jgi:hypothetical protein